MNRSNHRPHSTTVILGFTCCLLCSGCNSEEEPAEDVVAEETSDATLEDISGTDTSGDYCGDGSAPIHDDGSSSGVYFRFIHVEVLEGSAAIDAIALHPGPEATCALHVDSLIDTHPTSMEVERLYGAFDAVVDNANGELVCNDKLAMSLPQTGDFVTVQIAASIEPGMRVEVRDAAACDDGGPPGRLRVEVRAFDSDPGFVIGEGSGPILELTVPEDLSLP